VIAPYGRLRASLPLGAEGVIDAPLPGVIAQPPFARFGNALVVALVLGCWLAAITARRGTPR